MTHGMLELATNFHSRNGEITTIFVQIYLRRKFGDRRQKLAIGALGTTSLVYNVNLPEGEGSRVLCRCLVWHFLCGSALGCVSDCHARLPSIKHTPHHLYSSGDPP